MESIGKMSQLLAISGQQINITTRGITELRKLKGLQRLRLDYVRMHEEDLHTIGTLTNLTYLSLNHCDLRDDMLKNFKSLTKLRTLLINSNKRLSDKGIENIAGFPELAVLDLGLTAVTSHCAESLKKLPALIELTLGNAAVSKMELQHQLPHCKVATDKEPRLPLEIFAPLK
jgi:hypothetical protein